MYFCFGKWQPSRAAAFAVLFVTLLCAEQVKGQSSAASVPIPTSTSKLGQFDAAGLSEILDHVRVVGTAPWTGIQGRGTIVLGGDAASYSATLTVVGNSKFRLDAQTANGPFSIRINGRSGSMQGSDGKSYAIMPETAASGIVQFQLPRLADLQTNSSVIDHGQTVLDGATLHRLTIERPFASGRKNIATDLYFDPKTHLLVETVNAVELNGARSSLLRTVAYGDYRQVDGVMIPFQISQTISGQKQWTLHLSDVQLNPSTQSTYFAF